MAYVSLYRKYRPTSFADVVGQDHVIRTLVNAIDDDRLHHAYLFTGPRGTGKTSTARLLAKAINCETGPTSSPCDTCPQCVAITQGTSVDVIELDMASHGGVDDARELRDRALFAPAAARRKVYILDEVHMASTAAFNALLKLIEEPPSHVLFAMATTDPQKVLPTILSRVQRLDLRRVNAADVAANVRRVCDLEGYAIDDDAVDAIVRAGDGSLRDTQSILEQVLAFAGSHVTGAAVAQVLGTTPLERVVQTVDLLGSRDLAGLLALVQGLLDDGHDLRRFTLDLVQHLRDLLVLQVAPDRPDLVDATDDRRQRLQAQAEVLPRETLLRAVGLLADTVAEQRQGSPRLPLELCLAQLAVPGADGDVAELADRLSRLEAAPARPVGRPGGGSSPPSPAASADPDAGSDVQVVIDVEDDGPAPPPSPPDPPADPERPASSSPERGRAGAATATRAATAAPADVAVDPLHVDTQDAPAPAGSPEVAVDSLEVDTEDAPAPSDLAEAGDERAAQTPAEPAVEATEAPAAEGADAPAADEATAPAAAEPDAPAAEAADVAGDAPAGAPTADSDPLAMVQAHWDGALELVRQTSKRCHAIFEPATPVAASRGILSIKYGRRYASFHAANATKGEFSDVLLSALERACGTRFRLDVLIDGDDTRRRPLPPSVTPDDARTPVLDPTPPVDVDEEAEVREAEDAATSAPDVVDVDQLLSSELDAELLDEEPPPGRESA